jgi:hypothetical protein
MNVIIEALILFPFEIKIILPKNSPVLFGVKKEIDKPEKIALMLCPNFKY